MKTIFAQALKKFIEDFGLSKNGTICFNAEVTFTSSDKNVQLTSEVQVISMTNKQIDVIYLLSFDSQEPGLPYMFPVNEESILYLENDCITIKDESLAYGNFRIEIKPILKSDGETK